MVKSHKVTRDTSKTPALSAAVWGVLYAIDAVHGAEYE